MLWPHRFAGPGVVIHDLLRRQVRETKGRLADPSLVVLDRYRADPVIPRTAPITLSTTSITGLDASMIVAPRLS